MAISGRILKTLDPLHRAGLKRVRAGSAYALARRDKGAPVMRETRELAILPDIPVSARLFVPANAADTGPALIFFHGGGFVLGGIDSHEALCRRLAQAAGLRVILATYRLAPEHMYPAQLEDAATTLSWVVDHAAGLGVDPARLALGGDSAGGYLAIALTRMLNQSALMVRANVLFYPVLHLDDTIWGLKTFQDSRIVGRLAIRYINAQFAGDPPPSLLGHTDARTPPTIITLGGALDPVRPDVLAYAYGLQEAGVPVTLFSHGLLPHGFGNLTHVSADARKALTEVGEATGRALA